MDANRSVVREIKRSHATGLGLGLRRRAQRRVYRYGVDKMVIARCRSHAYRPEKCGQLILALPRGKEQNEVVNTDSFVNVGSAWNVLPDLGATPPHKLGYYSTIGPQGTAKILQRFNSGKVDQP
jgi:hypothetical protein